MASEDSGALNAVADVRRLGADEARRLDGTIADRDWSVIPPGFERVDYAVPSGTLAGVELGDACAPRVVLVPGITGSKEDFVLLMPLIAAAGFRVVSFDLAGQYESAAAGPERLTPRRLRYDHALFVDDLIAVMEKGSTPAHLLGYSFAGTVAQLAAVVRPDLVRSLVLLACPPVSGQSFRGMRVLGRASGLATADVAAALMIWGVRNNLNRVAPGRVAFARMRFARTRRDSVRDALGLMRRTPDVEHSLRALGIPILVAAGQHDLWPSSAHRSLAARLGARAAIYAAGHSPCETTPYQLGRDMVALYDAAEASG